MAMFFQWVIMFINQIWQGIRDATRHESQADDPRVQYLATKNGLSLEEAFRRHQRDNEISSLIDAGWLAMTPFAVMIGMLYISSKNATYHRSGRIFRSKTLPPMPPIILTGLDNKVFDYTSSTRKLSLDYELLGDSVLGFCVTVLLHDMYPTLQPVGATEIRSRLVSNETLTQIASQYIGFQEQIRWHPGIEVELRKDGLSLQAKTLKAYIGALHLDMRIGCGMALDDLKSWIFKIFRPLAKEAYQEVQREMVCQNPTMMNPSVIPVSIALERTFIAQNSACLTPPPSAPNVCLYSATTSQPISPPIIASESVYGRSITRFEPVRVIGASGKSVWEARVIIDGRYEGVGEGSSKKAAANEASKIAFAKAKADTPS